MRYSYNTFQSWNKWKKKMKNKLLKHSLYLLVSGQSVVQLEEGKMIPRIWKSSVPFGRELLRLNSRNKGYVMIITMIWAKENGINGKSKTISLQIKRFSLKSMFLLSTRLVFEIWSTFTCSDVNQSCSLAQLVQARLLLSVIISVPQSLSKSLIRQLTSPVSLIRLPCKRTSNQW